VPDAAHGSALCRSLGGAEDNEGGEKE